MGLIDNLRNGILSWLLADGTMTPAMQTRINVYSKLREYYGGVQARQLALKTGKPDDNLIINFTRLVVERAVSRLFGGPVSFDLPGEGEREQDRVLSAIWAANKQAIRLHHMGQFGALYGTDYVKLVPEGIEARDEENKLLPRIIVLDPTFMQIETDPEDIERVMKYTMLFAYQRPNGDQFAKREEHVLIVDRAPAMDGEGKPIEGAAPLDLAEHWEIVVSISDKSTGGRWRIVSREIWPWEFPQLLHWQNLPLADSVYGLSDIADVLSVQDRENFVLSNISKIIRYHAHPKTWGRQIGQTGEAEWGADQMITSDSPTAHIENLEMQSELGSSTQFAESLRQALFDVSRTVDISSMVDKAGQLTNFGLRVLYKDELDKLYTKRELYGDALTEINHRLLVMSGFSGKDANGGVVIWPEPLPVSETDQALALKTDKELGIASLETIAAKRGYDWAKEQARIANDKQGETNIGAELLKAFTRGA